MEYLPKYSLLNVKHLDVNMIADRTTYFTACKNSVYQLEINIKYFLIADLEFNNIFKNQLLLFTELQSIFWISSPDFV